MVKSRPTIMDVAARSGFSKSLVSLALAGSPKVGEESRTKILRAAAELGYRANAAARSLAARRSNTIGVLVLDLHNPVFAEILDGVQGEARSHGLSTMLVSGGTDATAEREEIEKLLEFQVDGLILISHQQTQTHLAKIASEVPTVVVTRDDIATKNLDIVTNDDFAGAELAVGHLINLGHKKIVHLNGGDNPVATLREQGYRNRMESAGLSSEIRVLAGGLTEGAGFSAAQAALVDPPTAIFCANDVAAIGAIAAIEQSGLQVPQDISVIGYDGIRLGSMRRINLTTVSQPLSDLGSTAARLLWERIEKPALDSRRSVVSGTLQIRGTTRHL